MNFTMTTAAPQGNEIRASEDPRAILSPTPAQIRHDQAKRPNFDAAKNYTKLLPRNIGTTFRQHFQNLIFGGRGRAVQITFGRRTRRNTRLNTMQCKAGGKPSTWFPPGGLAEWLQECNLIKTF